MEERRQGVCKVLCPVPSTNQPYSTTKTTFTVKTMERLSMASNVYASSRGIIFHPGRQRCFSRYYNLKTKKLLPSSPVHNITFST